MKEEGEKKFDQRNNPLFIQVDTTVNNHWTQQLTNTTSYYVDFLSFFTESHTKIVTLYFNGDVKDFFKCVKHSVVLFFLLWSNAFF
jgi:hypothetical protein